MVESYPPKSTFSEDHTSSSKGCCAPKFLHALENDQILLAQPPPRMGVLLTIFSKGFKHWLRFYRICAYNFKSKGSKITKLCYYDVPYGEHDH